jgi:hypothetical protein
VDGVCTTIDVPGAPQTIIVGINQAGKIVGTDIDPAGRNHAFVAVPEPAAALTAGALLLAAGYWVGRTRLEEDPARSTPRTIYVIQEFSWRFRGNRFPLLQDDGRPGKPGWTPGAAIAVAGAGK